MTPEKFFSHFPDARQELLLKACLLDGDKALFAWDAWRALTDVEDLDIASQRLLPLAYHNLRALGVNHPDLSRYQGIARRVWYENQLRLHVLDKLLDIFHDADIPVLLLKGIAVTPLYYRNWSLRAWNDLDILVPISHLEKANSVLDRSGWISPQAKLLCSSSFRTTSHAVAFKNAQGLELDLHWHVIYERCQEDADNDYWAHAQAIRFKGRQEQTLCDTDHLFHTCVHATRRDTVPPIRWIADAKMILDRSEVDWQRFINLVVKANLVRRLRPALSYLHDVFRLPIPSYVLSDIASRPSHPIEIVEGLITSDRLPLLARKIGGRYAHYRRNTDCVAAPSSFFAYLRAMWGISSRSAAIVEGMRRLARNLGFRRKATQ